MSAFLRPVALLLFLTSAFGLDLASLTPQGYVSDFANVVSPGQRQALEAYCAHVEQRTGAQMALVTIPTLDGDPVEDVANDLYRRWGIGKKGKDEGLLLLLVVQDRRSRLEIGYGLEPILPDGLSGSILRDMRPALREGAYGDALTVAGHVLGSRIAEAKNVTLDETARPRPSRQRRPEPAIPFWVMVVGGLLLLSLLGRGGGRGGGGGMGSAFWLAALMASGGRHRGGGGFGGYDSGGGFGGFGGGDSGGGGASSNW